MGKLMTMFNDIWRRLSDKAYREQYALSVLKRSVAFQIKTLRKKHCGSQAVLAERSQLTQGVVSRAEDQEYGNLTFNTVGRIAAGLDMAFIGRFVPFSELERFAQDLSEDEFANVPTFKQEIPTHERPSWRFKLHRTRPRPLTARKNFQRRKGIICPFPVRQNQFTGARKRPPQRTLEAFSNPVNGEMGQRAAIGE